MLLRFSTRSHAPARVKALLMGSFVFIALFITVIVSLAGPKANAITADNTLNFQARLYTAGGAVVPDGNYNIDFKIYNADTTAGTVGTCLVGSGCLWEETWTNAGGHGIKVVNGYFSVRLNSINNNWSNATNWDQQYYLTMNVTTTGTQVGAPITTDWNGEMQNASAPHDIALTAVPLALRANQLAVAGTNEQILQFASSTFTQATTISLPDPGATTATICYQGATACGFATGTTGSYIQNSAGGPQSANFNIQSAASGSIGGVITGASGQSVDILDIDANAVANPLFKIASAGAATFRNSTNSAAGFTIQNSGGANILNVDTNGANQNNIITNPSFEGLSTTGWAPDAVVAGCTLSSVTSATTVPYSGLDSAQCSDTATIGTGMKYVTGALTANTVYTFDFYSKVSAGSGTVLNFGHVENAGAEDASGLSLTSQYATTSGWTHYSLTFKTGATLAAGDYLYIKQNDATARSLWVDGVTLQTDANADNSYREGKVQLSGPVTSSLILQNASNSTTAFQVQNASGAAVFTVDDTDSNLIANPGAEVNAVGWAGKGTNGTVIRDTSKAKYGYASFKLTGSAANDGAAYTFPTSLPVGTYSIAVSVTLTGNAFPSNTLVFGLTNGSGDNNCSAISPSVTATTPSSGGWTRFTSLSCTISTTAATAFYVKQTDATSHAGVNAYWIDGIEIDSGGVISPYGVGAISINGVVRTPLSLQNQSNSTNALTLQDTSSNTLLAVDTLNDIVSLGSTGSQALASTVNIANSTGAGTQTVNIGATNAANNVVLIQGGTTSSAVLVQSGAAGTIGLGTANTANTIQIGSTTLSSGTQTISIGNNATSGGTTAITIGTSGSAGGSTAIQSTGVLSLKAISGANTTTLSLQAPTAVVTYSLQTAAAGAYNLCTTASVCAGYAASSGAFVSTAPTTTLQNTISPATTTVVALTVNGNTVGTAAQAIIVNQSGVADAQDINLTNTSGAQTAGLLINRSATGGTTTNALDITGTYTNLITAPNFGVNNSGSVTANFYNTNTFNNAGVLLFGNAGAGSVDAASGQALNLGAGASNHTTTLGSTNGTANVIVQGGTSATAIAIQSGNASTITIGSQTASTVNNIIIGAAAATTNADVIGINNTSGTNNAAITIGGSGLASGTITLGQSTTTNIISIGSAATLAANSTQTVNIANGTGTTTNGEVVNIANGVPTAGTSSQVNIATGGTTNGVDNVTIGSAGTANHTLVLQGGNGTIASTGAAIKIQTATAGDTLIGAAAGTGQIVLGSSTAGQTVAIANGTGAPVVNIANASVSGATISIVGANNTSANSVSILNGASGANDTFNLLSGAGTAGAGDIHIGNNARVNVIDIGNVATAAARTITIGGGNTPTGISDTVNIATGNTVGTGTKVVHIADGNPAGTNAVTLGSVTATANTTLIQGGNGATAIQLQSASGGTISIGNNGVANTIQIGQNGANAVTQTIDIGNGSTGSTTNVVIGNTIAGTVNLQPAGGVNVGINNSQTGKIIFNTSAGTSTATITLAGNNATNSYVYQLPTTAVASNQCLQSGTVSGANVPLAFGACGSGSDLQGAYNASSSPATITTTATAKGIIFKAGAGFDSTSLFQVQNAGSLPVFNIDTTTNNLITNPSFEPGTTGWATVGTGTGHAIAQNSTLANVYNGNDSLQVTTDSNQANTGAQVTSFTSAPTAGSYVLSFYIKGGATNGNFNTLSVTLTGAATTCTLTLTQVFTNGYQQSSCSFTSTGTLTAINFLSTDAATQHIFYLDGVQLVTSANSKGTGYGEGSEQLLGIVNSPVQIQTPSDSTSALQVLNAAGNDAVLNVDTMNLRVGINTSTPQTALSVYGPQFGAGFAFNILTKDSAAFAQGVGGGIGFGGIDDGIGTQVAFAGIQGYKENATSGNDAGALGFSTRQNGGAGLSQVLTLSSVGAAKFENSVNSNIAFQVQTATGDNVLAVDTTNSLGTFIANPSFEQTLSGWTASGTGASVAQTSAQSYQGSKSLDFVTGTAIGNSARYNLGAVLSTSTTYTLSFYATSDTSFSTLSASYSPDGTTGNENDCAVLSPSTNVLSSAWTQYTCTIDTSTTAATGSAFIAIKQTDATSRNLYIDGIQLTAGGAITSGQVQETSFESALSSWANLSSTSIAQSAADHFDGADDLLITGSTTVNSGAKYTTTATAPKALSASTNYQLSFWAKASGSAFSTLQATYSQAGTTGGEVACVLNSTSLITTAWQYYTCAFTTSATAPVAASYIAIEHSDGVAHTWVVDNVQLTKISLITAPSSYKESGIELNGTITTPLNVQDSAGSMLLYTDTANDRIDIGTGGVSTGQLYVSGVTPASGTAVGSISGFGLVDAIKFQGNFMYATDWIHNNLDVFDVSNPANLSISQISTTSLNGVCNSSGNGVNDLFVAGHYAYMDCQGSPNNFLIYDISNPFAPSRVSTLSLGADSFPDGVYVQGRYAYVNGGGGAGMYLGVIDIGNPANPIMVNNTTIASPNSGQSIVIQGKYLYENTAASTLQIYDLSNPVTPVLIGTSATFTGGTTCSGDFSPDNIAVQGIYVYVAECAANGFQVFNVSNPASISGGTFISTGAGSEPFELVVQDRALYVESNVTGVMQMYDISTPTSAFPVGTPMSVGVGSEAIGVNGRYLYGGDTSLFAYDIGGAYIQQLETGGIQTNSLNVTGLAAFGSNITTAGSVSVGQGLQVAGDVGIAGRLNVTGNAPTAALDSVATGTTPTAETILGHYLYELNWSGASLKSFDISNPANMVNVGTVTTAGNGASCNGGALSDRSIYGAGKYIYLVECANNTFEVYDVSNPTTMVRVSSTSTGAGGPISVYVQGRYAYVINDVGNTMQIFDVANPASPVSISTTAVGAGTDSKNVYVQGRYAYVVASTSTPTLKIFDVSNPYAPVATGGSIATSGAPEDVIVNGRYAYVPNQTGNTVQVFDVSNPTSIPAAISTFATGSGPDNEWLQGHYLYVEEYNAGAIIILDVSNPANLVQVGSLSVPLNPLGIVVQGRYAYVTNVTTNLLYSFDLGGAYIQQLEAGGLEADTLAVDNNALFASDVNIQGGASIGQGLAVGGSLAISTSGAGNSALTVSDKSTGINLLDVKDLSQTFGAASTSGAFISNTSYLGEEFNADGQQAGITANANIGDDTNSNWRTTSATDSYSTPRAVNGLGRFSFGTTTGVGSMYAYGKLTANAAAIDATLKTGNLPLMQTKFVPVQSGGTLTITTDYFIGMMDTTTPPTVNDTLPANGVLLWSDNSIPATGGSLTYQGVVRSGSATIGTPVSCTGAYTYGNSVVARIIVTSTTTADFQMDFNAGDGINFTDCGVVTGTFPTAQLSPEFYGVHNEATARQFDIDYIRTWQDDNSSDDSSTDSSTTDTTPPLTADSANGVAGQMGIIDFTTATSEDTVFNNNVYVHGTLYADKIVANQIEGLSVYTDQLASLQQQLTAVKAASTSETTSDGSGSEDSSSGTEESGSAGAGAGGGLSFDVSSGGLVIGADTTFTGNVFFYKLVTFVQKTVFNDDVTLGGHVLTAGTTPTATLETAAGITTAPPADPANPNAPAPNLAKDTIIGNDNSGQLNITFGDSATAGEVLTVNFNKTYSAAPNVFLSPTNAAAAGLKYYITSTTTGFKITLIDPPATTTNMTFGYWVVQ